eukprot:6210400-Pleurochrysis_carterae.AAC.2
MSTLGCGSSSDSARSDVMSSRQPILPKMRGHQSDELSSHKHLKYVPRVQTQKGKMSMRRFNRTQGDAREQVGKYYMALRFSLCSISRLIARSASISACSSCIRCRLAAAVTLGRECEAAGIVF